MPYVLTTATTVTCAHGGQVTRTPAPKLVVGGNKALAKVGPVTTCSIQPPPATNVKCTAVTVSSGQTTKLNVGGSPVLLSSLSATAAAPANPGGALVVTPSPTKLNAV